MKKFFVLCAALTMGASAAYAGVDLSWDGCAGNALATGSKAFTCDAASTYELYGNVQPSAPVVQFLGAQGQIDLQSEGGPIPEFWSFEIGGANNAAFSYGDARGATNPACAALNTLWGSTGAGGTEVFQYDRGPARGMPLNRALLQFADARTTPLAATLTAGANYYVFTITIDETSAATLAGCSSPVAMVLNEIDMASATNPIQAEVAPGVRGQCSGANGATPATCAATPTKDRTWGSVKSLYR